MAARTLKRREELRQGKSEGLRERVRKEGERERREGWRRRVGQGRKVCQSAIVSSSTGGVFIETQCNYPEKDLLNVALQSAREADMVLTLV